MAKGKFHRWLTEDGLKQIEEWAKRGLIDEQIAKNMGIGTSTLYEWKNRFPEIVEALKRGKEIVDQEVENALLKRALGYQYVEVRTEREGEGPAKITETVKEVLPDVGAQIFWLKNRQPEKWRDKQNIEHSGPGGGPVEVKHFAKLDDNELDAIIFEKLESISKIGTAGTD